MNQQLIVENIRNLTNVLPIEKIQLFDQDLVVIVKSNILLDVLLFFKYHILYRGEEEWKQMIY